MKSATATRVEDVPIELIYPDPDQPRKTFEEGPLAELAASIKQHGVLQPIRVRDDQQGRFKIIMGERRYRASTLAQLPSIPCVIVTTDEDQLVAQITENRLREPMEPLEEAAALQRLLDNGHAAAEIGRALGRKVRPELYVEELVGLLQLTPIVQDALRAKAIDLDKAMSLCRLTAENQRAAFVALRDGEIGPGQEFQRFCQQLEASEKQGGLFEVDEIPAEKRATVQKFDDMLDRVDRFVRKTIDANDAGIIGEVLDGNVASRLTRLDLLIKYLGRIRVALKHGKAKQLAIDKTKGRRK